MYKRFTVATLEFRQSFHFAYIRFEMDHVLLMLSELGTEKDMLYDMRVMTNMY